MKKRSIQVNSFLRDMRFRFQERFVRREYKDRLFIKLFHDKRELLRLYNALNGTAYEDAEDLVITTIDDVVYMGMKNDCSFIIGSYLNLYEHQSTYNPNMPLRALLYLARIYESYIKRHQLNLYGSKQIMLPTPRCVVFYNGTDKQPEIRELHLRDAFEKDDSCLEFTVTMYNINIGFNQELMRQCSTLEGYAILVGKVREYCGAGIEAQAAVDKACVYCIEHDILREFLEKNRSEVMRVLLTEWNPKKQREMDIRDAREAGRAEGLTVGHAEGHAEAKLEGIFIFIESQKEMNVDKEETIWKLQKYYKIREAEAKIYYERFLKERVDQ